MTGILEAIRCARESGETLAAIDAILAVGYPIDRAVRACVAPPPSHVLHAARVLRSTLKRRLADVKGRKRNRTITYDQVIGAIAEALNSGRWGWIHGGYPTANSYGYSWDAMTCGAVVDQGVLRVSIVRTSRRTGPWGMGAWLDRATREQTIRRSHEQLCRDSLASFDAQVSIETAMALVNYLEDPLKGKRSEP